MTILIIRRILSLHSASRTLKQLYIRNCAMLASKYALDEYQNDGEELNLEFDHLDEPETPVNQWRKRLPPKVTAENQYSWITSKVNPFITLPYSEQLRLKFISHREILLQLDNLTKTNNRSTGMLLPCKYDGVIPSPLIYGYRNKDNFHIGVGIDGDPRTVGQIVGSSSRQEVFTVSTELLVSSPVRHKAVLRVLQEFVRTVQVPASFTGSKFFWQDGFIRSNRAGDIALAICLNPKGLSLSDILREKDKFIDHFSKGAGSRLGLHSLHIKVSHSSYGSEHFELVFGRDHLVEKLIEREFHISPDAFFQVNPYGAEVLYSTVRQLASMPSKFAVATSKLTLVDACCGTGTIGVLLADLFENVVGFDIEEAAVENARKNAVRNNIVNARYYTGPAKACLKYMLSRGVIKSDNNTNIVAVVNPSRSGLANSVMRELRSIPAIKRVVYVSCNPGGRCLNNFELLCRSTRPYLENLLKTSELSHCKEQELPGRPFVPIKAISVDMFPHTRHCEMVIAFERN